MRTILQRVSSASVVIDGKCVGQIDQGYLVLVGFTHDDTESDIDYMVEKVKNLRVFSDDDGNMNRSLLDVHGKILSVSQFTLYADARKGRRPSFINAMHPEQAAKMYDLWNEKLRQAGIEVQTGVFGADMKVTLTNDGPVTICLESRK